MEGSAVNYRSFRHWGGFIFSGASAFVVDATVTTALVHFAGLDPFSSRLVAMACATVAAWLLHRWLTFHMTVPPSLAEFGRFVSVALGAHITNYVIYALILLARPATPPIVALVLSTCVSMVVSYVGFRRGVFRRPIN